MMSAVLALTLAARTIVWEDFPQAARDIAASLGITPITLPARIAEIRTRNEARLREGEIDHLVFYMLQSRDFTSEPPLDPAAIAAGGVSDSVRGRMRDLEKRLKSPITPQERYFAGLTGFDLEKQTARVLAWIHEKEQGCQASPSPQACIADLYPRRGHSSDTSPQSMIGVRAALEWLRSTRNVTPQRVLIIGPGSDFAPRTALRTIPPVTYQPQALREILGPKAVIDCADLNPRVVTVAAGNCGDSVRLDLAVEALGRKYDAVIATNVLLYFDQTELLLAFQNVKSMLSAGGVFLHNDGRYEATVFGRVSEMPVVHYGSVSLNSSRRPALVDRFVIHGRSALQ